MNKELGKPAIGTVPDTHFLSDLLGELESTLITEPIDMPSPYPDNSKLYTARRLWLPSEGDVFDSDNVKAVVSRFQHYAVDPTKLGMTLLPRWCIKRLAADDESQRPTQEAVSTAAAGLLGDLPVVVDRVDRVKGYAKKWFVAYMLDQDSARLSQEESMTVIRGLNPQRLLDVDYEHLGHISVFCTESENTAIKISEALSEATEYPGKILLGKVGLRQVSFKS